MERRLARESKGPLSLQKKLAETRRKEKPAPDLTDFMNDMFFGTADMHHRTYDFTGGKSVDEDEYEEEEEEEEGFDDSRRSNSARLTQEWLQEARRIVASSPSRCDSPSRLSGSPRFAAPQPQPASPTYPRDNLSRTRSARRYRAGEGISDEILSKTAKHTRNKSDTFAQDGSPATAVHNWFSNILKPANNNNTQTQTQPPPSSPTDPTLSPSLPPRQPLPRKSRFQTEPSPAPHHSRRTFKTCTPSSDNLPSDSVPLSPPRKLLESAHRRTILSSTCSQERIAPGHVITKGEEVSLNWFLKEQRILFQKISRGELHANAQIVLSGPSNS